jgi:hypothetical protein
MDEGETRPSRWNTLRATRVLRWYGSRADDQIGNRMGGRGVAGIELGRDQPRGHAVMQAACDMQQQLN